MAEYKNWAAVTMEPPLPVNEGTSVTFSCPRKHVNVGGRTVTCEDGVLEPEKPPSCTKLGNVFLFSFNWEFHFYFFISLFALLIF